MGGRGTTTLRLATGIVILPQRNPVVLAKQIASLDVLSGGRVTFGVGVGYLEPEFRAIGADSSNRARSPTSTSTRCTTSGTTSTRSTTAASSTSPASTRTRGPVQRPIPIVIGGHTPPAYRRAVTHAHGWYGFAADAERPGGVARRPARRGRRLSNDRPSSASWRSR